jgi:hypothetical protein
MAIKGNWERSSKCLSMAWPFSVYVRKARGGVAMISDRIKEIDLKNIRGTARDSMALSHFLRDCGLLEAAAK